MDNKGRLIRIQDTDLSNYRNEYEALKSILPKLAWRKVSIYVAEDDYEKYKEFIIKKQPSRFGTKSHQKLNWNTYLSMRGLKPSTVRNRIKLGWSLEDAVNTPKGDKNPARLSKKRVQAFTDNNKASGAILRGVTGKNQFALKGRLNTLGEAEEFLNNNKQVKNEWDVFNDEENAKYWNEKPQDKKDK